MNTKLAIEGGRPIRRRPLPFEFPGGNHIDEQEVRAVTRVVRSRSLFRYYGPRPPQEVERFETEFAPFVGRRYALGVNSGTQALAIAMSALGIGPGCEVIVPGYFWIAIAASILRLGAIPVLAEVDDSFTIDPEDIPRRLTKRTKLIVAVHMSGAPADMARIMAVSRRRGIPVLEDCAQANGASFRGRSVGSFGAMAIYSLQLNKNLTAGEGGIIVTDSRHLYQRAFAIHDLGYPRVGGRLQLQNSPYALWGFGGRMSELTGAIARVQLRKLPKVVRRMRLAKAAIKAGLRGWPGLSWRRLNDPHGDSAAFLIFSLGSRLQARRAAAALNAENIRAGLSSTMTLEDFGMHIYSNIPSLVEKHSNTPDGFPWTLPANRHSRYDYHRGALPQTDRLIERSLILPVPSVMSARDIQDTVSGIRKVLGSRRN